MNKQSTEDVFSLANAPKDMKLVPKGTVLVVTTKLKKVVILKYMGYLLLWFGVVFLSFIPDAWMLMEQDYGIIGTVMVLLLIGIFLIFWGWMGYRLWELLKYHSQYLKVVLHKEKALFLQLTVFHWRQRHQLYTKEQLQSIHLQPIKESSRSTVVPIGQQGIQFQAKEETPLWGDCLEEEQLTYIVQLLQEMYVQEQAERIFISLKDFSKHLLEE